MSVFAGRAVWPQPFMNRRGDARANVTTLIYLRGTTTPAELWTTRTKATAATNPTTTDASGNLWVFLDPGDYDAVIAGVTMPFTVVPDEADIVDVTTDQDIDGVKDAAEFHFRRGTAGTDPEAFRSYLSGSENDRVTAALGQLADDGGGHLVLKRPYEVEPFIMPADSPIAVHGHDPEVCQLQSLATEGGYFIVDSGSGAHWEGVGIDARRAEQSNHAGPALLIAKPNGTSGGGAQISGGLLLTAPVAEGAMALPVSTSVLPGGYAARASDVITIAEGSQFEILRVAVGYTGGAPIELETPTQFDWTVAAQVSLALDRAVVDGLIVFGLFTAVSLWHCHNFSIRDVVIPDVYDTGVDIEGGCHDGSVVDCIAGGVVGKIGCGLDDGPEAPGQYGPVSVVAVRGMRTRFASGGEGQLDGIYAGRCSDVTIEGGSTDLRAGGETGIRTLAGITERLSVKGHTVLGPTVPRANTFGLRCANQIDFGPGEVTVEGMNISNVHTGIDGATDSTITAVANRISDVNTGMTMTASGVGVQRMTSVANRVDGCFVGVIAGGAPTAGSKLYSRGDYVTGEGFLKIFADTGSGWLSDVS